MWMVTETHNLSFLWVSVLRLALNIELLLFSVSFCAKASPEHRNPAVCCGSLC